MAMKKLKNYRPAKFKVQDRCYITEADHPHPCKQLLSGIFGTGKRMDDYYPEESVKFF